MSKLRLCPGKVLVALVVLVERALGDLGGVFAVHRDHLVLLVEELDVLGLPLAVLDQAEEDEAAIALDIAGDALDVGEALRDGGLHLADAALLRDVDVGQRPVLAVHDEVALRAALFGYVDKVVY